MATTLLRKRARPLRRLILSVLPALLAFAGSDLPGQTPSPDEEIQISSESEKGIDAILAEVSQETVQRQQAAAEELNRTRERIAAEKAPMLQRMRAAEDRILAATAESRRLKTQQENAAAERRRLLKDVDAARKITVFATTTARDSLAALRDSLPPGEPKTSAEAVSSLVARMDNTERAPEAQIALDGVSLLLTRLENALGGYTTEGEAIHATTNQVMRGQFAYAGPEVFFQAADHSIAGPVRQREGSDLAVVYPMAAWDAGEASRFFAGEEFARVPLDASGGKALKLQQTHGSVWSHIEKGGLMAFIILGVGGVAFMMIVQKARDVIRMRPSDTNAVESLLAMIARDDSTEAARILAGLKGPTRELFDAGLTHRGESKALLEEHLESVLLEQRLHFERRLPLLAVIATAAPLMGLLGTVVGMVKTFALITVFGTGNAGKLSSGISEVLVATELGLAVAIPTLIVHGFLAHRIEKNLSQLERYALRFAIAVETARARGARAAQPVNA